MESEIPVCNDGIGELGRVHFGFCDTVCRILRGDKILMTLMKLSGELADYFIIGRNALIFQEALLGVSISMSE